MVRRGVTDVLDVVCDVCTVSRRVAGALFMGKASAV